MAKKGFTKNDKNINRSGRPKGTPNKTSEELRAIFKDLLSERLEELGAKLDSLDAKDYINVIITIATKIIIAPPITPERLTEQQILQIIDYLKNQQL